MKFFSLCLQNKVKTAHQDLTSLEEELENMGAIGRDIRTVNGQIEEVKVGLSLPFVSEYDSRLSSLFYVTVDVRVTVSSLRTVVGVRSFRRLHRRLN